MLSSNELFLESWLRISSTINNERIVSNEMTFNEALICNFIYYSSKHNPDVSITVKELCKMTNMHKTLMNRTLSKLEEKRIITRVRDEEDKRRVVVCINNDNFDYFLRVHAKTMKFVDKVSRVMGAKEVAKAIKAFDTVSDAVRMVENNFK